MNTVILEYQIFIETVYMISYQIYEELIIIQEYVLGTESCITLFRWTPPPSYHIDTLAAACTPSIKGRVGSEKKHKTILRLM